MTGTEWINKTAEYLISKGWNKGCLSSQEWQNDPAKTMHPPEQYMPSYLCYDIWEAYRVETEVRQRPNQLYLF